MGERRVAMMLASALVLSACAGGGPGAVAPDTASMPATPTSTSVANATAGTIDDRREGTFPGAQWERIDPAAAGMDAAELDRIAHEAEAAQSTCLAVFRDGKLVEDWYWNGSTPDTPAETWSVTKSLTSTVVGIAEADGRLDIDDPAATYIKEWAGTPSAGVTIKHLLSNTSGRFWTVENDYLTLTAQPDKTGFAIGLDQAEAPGTRWAYNNAAIQTLSRIMKVSTGVEASEYARRAIFEPIGMTRSSVLQDPSGNTLMYMGLQSTCLDMGRFGHLLLNHGNWDGRRIVPAAFLEQATGQASQQINGAYGYLFWVNRPGRLASSIRPATAGVDDGRPITQWVPGAPEDMYWAAGIGGQTIQIDPGTRTVVTRLGPARLPPGVAGFDRKQTAEVVTKAMLDS